MPLVELLSMPQVPNDLIICALSYNSPYKPPHNKRILDVKKRKGARRHQQDMDKRRTQLTLLNCCRQTILQLLYSNRLSTDAHDSLKTDRLMPQELVTTQIVEATCACLWQVWRWHL
jgi:hypothetical protein